MSGIVTLREPFFEIGPKCYLYGQDVLDLASYAAQASKKYNVQVLFTPQYVDIAPVAAKFPELLVIAPHMDPIKPGRGQGSVLPESLKAAGAAGVMLNHVEKPVTVAALYQALVRAKELDLLSIVCADSIAESCAMAKLGPDVIVAEPSELIGTGQTSDEVYVRETTKAIREVSASIKILQAAGIRTGQDVYNVIYAGAQGTGTSSGVIVAEDRPAMVNEMIQAVREAYDARTKK